MKDTSKLPALSVAELTNKTTGAIRPLKYRPGQTRAYRFNASTGTVNVEGIENVTKPGEEFSFVPVALRVFHEALFAKERREWAELFFISQGGVLCSIMFHRYSVANLMKLEFELYCDELNINEVVLTMKPVQKKNIVAESTYYIAEFTFKPAPADLPATMQKMIADRAIYRAETFTETAELLLLNNYAMPATVALPATVEAEK